ncbi:MAG TPA: LysR substrate-binding domain-containing protein [Polyangiales bacterium]
MDELDLNEVLVFTRVVDAQSFTAAAKRLALPKSTVSRKVSQLEQRLGVTLLSRTTRKLRLTDAGAAYYERCARVIAEMEEAERVVRDLQATPKGTLRVTAPVDIALSHLAPMVAEYTRKYPEVSVVLVLTSRVVDLVADGIDLALRAGQLPDSTLVARKLADSTMQLFASPAYLKKHGTPRSVAELSKHQCVLYGRELRSVWKLTHGSKLHEVAVQGRLCMDDLGAVRSAVVAGAGVGLLPVLGTGEDVRGKRLCPVLPDHRLDGGGLYLVYPSARHLSAASRSFIDFIVKGFAAA